MPLKNPNAFREWFNTIFYGALIAIIFAVFYWNRLIFRLGQ